MAVVYLLFVTLYIFVCVRKINDLINVLRFNRYIVVLAIIIPLSLPFKKHLNYTEWREEYRICISDVYEKHVLTGGYREVSVHSVYEFVTVKGETGTVNKYDSSILYYESSEMFVVKYVREPNSVILHEWFDTFSDGDNTILYEFRIPKTHRL